MKTKELETYQENVRRLEEMISEIGTAECGLDPPKIFRLENGEAKSWILFDRSSVTVSKWHLSPDAIFPTHAHASVEVIVVYEGSATYSSETVPSRVLSPGDCVRVDAEKPHRMKAGPEGAWLSITSVPREEAFSNGG